MFRINLSPRGRSSYPWSKQSFSGKHVAKLIFEKLTVLHGGCLVPKLYFGTPVDAKLELRRQRHSKQSFERGWRGLLIKLYGLRCQSAPACSEAPASEHNYAKSFALNAGRNFYLRALISVFLMWLLASWAGILAEDPAVEFAIMPMPAELKPTGQKFLLDDSFKIAIRGEADEKLYSSATRALRRLSGRTGLFFGQDYLLPGQKVGSPGMVIICNRPGKAAFGEDESYSLQITASEIQLTAPTSLGALRGLETLLQLLSADENGYYFPGVEINDQPRFPWRGLLIDACRHFMPVEVIKRNLDGMAALKLNVLHWHLSEDQGFRVESKTFPKLHESGSDGFYYTQAQIKDVIAYAEERGIRVVPEFDVPGHATSWLVGYPELGSAPGPYQIERKWGIFYPALNPANDDTYKFLDKLFGEMAALFPDPYFHIGGDELEHGDYHEAKHWNENPEIQAFMKKHNIPDNSALQAYFNSRILKSLAKRGKIMVGWDEILHENMPRNIVIQSWRGRDSMVKAAKMGYQSILSNGYYIDLIYPAVDHYLNDPLPADIELSDAEKKMILGGEATMWSEYISPETIDSRIWPRTAAIAERLWSPQAINDVDEMYRRLEIISFQLEEHGLTHLKNYPMMLRRLTGNHDITALKNLVDIIEPVKKYTRGQQRAYTSFSPLTRVVDAARPDARIAREFRNMVDQYLAAETKNEKLAMEINAWLTLWKNNHGQLVEIIKLSPVLAEIESLSEDLAIISTIGIKALSQLEQNPSEKISWPESELQALEKAKQPRGQTELMVVSALEKLVAASSGVELPHSN